ncbi:NAD-dependent succinate-semialdehyde dehydrogenase [Nocardioides bizhenqiangii]|uniref:NAD-dependent succinate-semialdehyde dehydrogenase n=1 Tax=Nocardioides bizhenqiangii TaxID=3095076 RepID=A0ABZ0ZSV0_9ACTN|nr:MULTISPECIES: NAD-dependent succinate-semialdehyde dehydrogenase [unclassified Nocardioides]MDZ5623566.1 NAD-dependent succinate-semialdehyde dehydrogenase [Nocardioides sp. HM23]WQQ27150.1 NAD-dependent succinate-semialdehyde dehydrogenase [Nocardioides sp. HM61]
MTAFTEPAVAGGPLDDASTFEVRDPATTQVIAVVPDGTAADATAAVDAAAAAFPSWAATAPRVRAEILRRAYELIVDDSDRLTALITAENGKVEADARAEVAYAAEFFRWFSEEAVRTEGAYGVSPAGGTRTIVTHRPVGVAALITPWNFPAAMATRKIAPALAAGCTVVLKPAAETPLTALAIAELLVEAGVPEGVVNVVSTTAPAEVVTTWLEDPRVRKVSFTGSTGVGRTLLKQAAERVLNSSMELGGNAPFVVTADADIEAAVAGAMIAKFRNGGQACTAANRFFVHADCLDEFVAALGDEVEALEVAPLISAEAVAGVTALVDEAVSAGAVVRHRGRTSETGWRYPATLLTDVQPGMRIAREEIFGPVVTVIEWTDESEMVARANDSEFGLAAYVYAGRLQDALRIAESLEAGMVGVNRGVVSDPAAPFGGFKQSGIGREGARDGIREYQETQYFSVDWP